MSNERKFSFLYGQIVESQDDMIGHIAYSLYKTQKIEYIKSFKEHNDDRPPTESDLDTYHLAAKGNIPTLRIQAEQLLTNFIELTLQESIIDIENKTLLNQQEILSAIIKPIVPKPPKGPWDGFWMGVLTKGVQTLVLALIVYIIVFSVSAKNNFWGTIKDLIPDSHVQPKDSIKGH